MLFNTGVVLKKEKYVEGTRSIFDMGRDGRSKGAVIPSEWFKRLKKMKLPEPEKIRWLLDNVGLTIPQGMSDTEALKHVAELLYSYYPKEFVDKIFDEKKEELLRLTKKQIKV